MTLSFDLKRRAAVRVALATGVTAAFVVCGIQAADAHVSITPSSAVHGSTAELTFRVPNEEGRAHTTKFQLQIPTDTPIAQLLVKPVPGWTVTTHSTKLSKPLVTDDGKFTTVVDEVTWSGGRIDPGQYEDFSLSADPLPDTGSQVAFKALQSYSDGTVVRWIDVSRPGQAEPEHPAPVLALTPESQNTSMQMATPTAETTTTTSSSSWPGVLAVIALLLALAAVGGFTVLWVRRPHSAE
jgi:periplasmic copper chaperone A